MEQTHAVLAEEEALVAELRLGRAGWGYGPVSLYRLGIGGRENS